MDKKKKLAGNALGILIKEAREEKKIKTPKLAEQMKNLKVTEKDIISWEKGQTFPNLDQIYKLAEILGINPNEALQMRNDIQFGDKKPPNESARRVGEKLLKLAEPGYNVIRTIIEVLIFVSVFMLFKYIHSSYESMDNPIVYQVENTLDNALEMHKTETSTNKLDNIN